MTQAQYPRFKRDLQAVITLADGSQIIGNTANLSTEGATILVDQRLKKDQHCILELKLKESPDTPGFKLQAEINYCSQLSETPGYGLGLLFTDTPEHYLSLIRHLEDNDV